MENVSQYDALFARAKGNATTQKVADTVRNLNSTSQAQGADQDKKIAYAKQAAEDFEAVYLSQMLTPIFDGLETEGPFGGGSSEKIYRSLMVQEYGKSIAKSGGIGISDAVQREILKLQEVGQ